MTISPQQKPLNSGFGPKSEPEDILANVDLSGKNVLVTGGYSGIGFEAVKALVGAGAHVTVPARDKTRAVKTLQGILPADDIPEMDLSDLTSVDRFTKEFAENCGALHLIIANAGVMACPEQKTAQGLEYQLGVNHFGHFVMITGLLDNLIAAEGARVVNLSSIAHRVSGMIFDDMQFSSNKYEKWTAYGQSKTAQSLMAVHMDKLYQDQHIRCFSVHPGGIFTPLQRHLQNEEMVTLGWTKEDGSPTDLAAQFFKTPTQGCTTSLFCATSGQLDNMGGVYCEDADIAKQVPADDQSPMGVRPWAVDRNDAERLWAETEKTLATL
ncbi:MAG: SDR family NAD(P)-dependent oxidoreductase [Parvularculales bacterium]